MLEDPLGIGEEILGIMRSKIRILYGAANGQVVARPGVWTSKMKDIVHGEANRVRLALCGTIRNRMEEEEIHLWGANREVMTLFGIPISKMVEILLGKQAGLHVIVTVEERKGLLLVPKQASLHGTWEKRVLVLVGEAVATLVVVEDGGEDEKGGNGHGPGVALVEEQEEVDLAKNICLLRAGGS